MKHFLNSIFFMVLLAVSVIILFTPVGISGWVFGYSETQTIISLIVGATLMLTFASFVSDYVFDFF